MPKVKDVVSVMEEIAPLDYVYTAGYDNVGLLVGDSTDEVSKVMCCLDVTQRVLDEAIAQKADMIVSHHPIIFTPVKSVADNTVSGRKILKAIKNGIAVYSAHTNLDFVRDGINDRACRLLNLNNIKNMITYGDGKGFGRIGELSDFMSAESFRKKVSEAFDDKHVLLVDSGKPCKKIAVINGGGGDEEAIDCALSLGADTLVTGDVKHHVAIYAMDAGINLIEPQHYTSEHFYIKILVEKLKEKAQKLNLQIIQSSSECNPRK